MTENLNQNIPPELSDNDAELLSAYLDNMLTDAERADLEVRLADDAFLRTELQAMRQTVAWLNAMPTLKAPRSFAIPEDVAAENPPNVVLMPRRNLWISAAAAAFVIALFGAVFVFGALFTQSGGSAPADESGERDIAFAATSTALPTIQVELTQDAVAQQAPSTAMLPPTATVAPELTILNSQSTSETLTDAEEMQEAEEPESNVARSGDDASPMPETFAMEASANDDMADADMADEAQANVADANEAAATQASQSQAQAVESANMAETQEGTNFAFSATTEQEAATNESESVGDVAIQARQPTITATSSPSPVPSPTAQPSATVTPQALAVQSTREMQATQRPAMAVTGTMQAAPPNIEDISLTATALAELFSTPTAVAQAGEDVIGASSSDVAPEGADAATGGATNTEPQDVLPAGGNDGDILLQTINLPDEATLFNRMRTVIYYIILRFIEFQQVAP